MKVPRILAISTVAIAAAACSSSQSLPGTMIGTFTTTGTVQTNSCGTGPGAPNPWSFTAQLSQDTTLLYWSWMDGSAPLSGALASQSATMTNSVTSNVDATADGGAGPCTMERDDSLVVNLNAATAATAFTGTMTYTFSATTGSDCSDQLASSASGGYTMLPCTLTYTLTGTKQ